MSNYASHSIKADRVNFLRQTNLDGADVNFNTNGNFNFTKPVNITSLLLRENYRVFVDEADDKIYFQKKVGDVFVSKFAFKFS